LAKMKPTMIALCAAAIGAIYTAGYVVTDTPGTALTQNRPAVTSTRRHHNFDNSHQQQPWVQPGNSANSGTTNSGLSGDSGSLGSTGSLGSPNGQQQYKDGIYYGEGSNRIGSVQVAVTIKQGKITACDIVRSTTHYRQSYIDPVLPQQVLDRQSSQVDLVSGATRSSEDFIATVQQALAQAES